MTRFRIGGSLAALLASMLMVLAGCAGQPLVGSYHTAMRSCCGDVSQLPYQPAPLGQDISFTLNDNSPAFTFPPAAALEPFAAFRMPDHFAVQTVVVTSRLSTDFLPNATAVYPVFLCLDTGFRQIARIPVTDFQSGGDFWGAALQGHAAMPRGTAYFIVVAGSTGGAVVSAQSGRPYVIPAAALGGMSLRLFGETTTN